MYRPRKPYWNGTRRRSGDVRFKHGQPAADGLGSGLPRRVLRPVVGSASAHERPARRKVYHRAESTLRRRLPVPVEAHGILLASQLPHLRRQGCAEKHFPKNRLVLERMERSNVTQPLSGCFTGWMVEDQSSDGIETVEDLGAKDWCDRKDETRSRKRQA